MNSNTPTPRPPRDQDEWIAVLVALGMLGGTAGWIMVGGFSPLRVGFLNADIEERTEFPGTIQADEDARIADSDEIPAAPTQRPTTLSPQDDGDDIDESGDRLNRSSRDSEPPEATSPPLVPGNPATPTPPRSSEETLAVPDPEVPDTTLTTDATNDIVREPLVFSDIPADYWAKPYIDALTARGFLNGFPDGTYAPDRPLTRAELATQVTQVFKLPTQLPTQRFTDIPENYWATGRIDEAVATGFMKGYPEQVFRPDQTVSRVEVLVTLVTGLALPEPSAAEPKLQQYQDQAEIPEWARKQVAAAIESGLITVPASGDAQLRPNAPATRAEVTAILYNALVYMGKVEPLE